VKHRFRHIREPGKPALIDLPAAPEIGETIRVMESPLANRRALLDAILKGDYRKPFIGENAEGRTLYLSLHSIQSRMRLDDPWALDLLYTRKAMSFLLFRPDPRRILMLGLGGGSLAKYCYRHLPAARVEAVEIDADVIALREYFCVPPPSHRFDVIQGDAAKYVESTHKTYDVVIADAFDHGGIPPSIRSATFYDQVRSRLREDGIMVSNFAGTRAERRDHLAMMARAFSDNVLLVPVEGEGNEIALAFNAGVAKPSWKAIHERARDLAQRFQLDFPRFASRIERSHKIGYLRRALSRPSARKRHDPPSPA
jgi:spermidine synthase